MTKQISRLGAKCTYSNVEREIHQIGDRRIYDLQARAGESPFFAYDLAAIERRVIELRQALPSCVKILYSPKVNPFQPLIHELARLVDGFDVASGGELEAALNTSVDPATCLLTGPGKTPAEIDTALSAGVIINVESSQQLKDVIDRNAKFRHRPKVSFRINPTAFSVAQRASRYLRTPFGFDPEQLPQVLTYAKAKGAEIVGFHGFFGSQQYDHNELAKTQARLFDLVEKLARESGIDSYFVNLGGGFPISFFEEEDSFSLEEMGRAMEKWMRLKSLPDGKVNIVLEFGRYLVAEAGYYVARVIDRKKIEDETFIVLDGGLNHNYLATGVFGREKSPNARVALCGDALEHRRITRVSIVGPLCTSFDRMATLVELREPEVGDYIIVRNAGAYGPTFSPINFLSRRPPVEMLVRSTYGSGI